MSKKSRTINETYLFDTPYTTEDLIQPTNMDPGSYDRENPYIGSYKLYSFRRPHPVHPGATVQATLLLVSPKDLPFLIDLTDLHLYVDGVKTSFEYVTNWVNNAAVIQFTASMNGGSHTAVFSTTTSINTNQASFDYSVSGVSTEFYLTATAITPLDARDVTLIKVEASQKDPVACTIAQASLTNESSNISGGVQTYALAAPSPSAPVMPAWFSFTINAYHPAFTDIECDLSFVDSQGSTLWSMPISLPTATNNVISLLVPYSNWNDAYTLLKVLSEDIGWQDGQFVLTWTHLNGDVTPVSLVEFTVFAADPALNQPITFTDQNSKAIVPIMPVVWHDGVTYLTFWSDQLTTPVL